MPWLVCPTCGAVSPRRTWPSVGGGFPFVLRCPCCAASSDVARLTMRLRAPEHERTARLALRVWRVVAALPAGSGRYASGQPLPSSERRR